MRSRRNNLKRKLSKKNNKPGSIQMVGGGDFETLVTVYTKMNLLDKSLNDIIDDMELPVNIKSNFKKTNCIAVIKIADTHKKIIGGAQVCSNFDTTRDFLQPVETYNALKHHKILTDGGQALSQFLQSAGLTTTIESEIGIAGSAAVNLFFGYETNIANDVFINIFRNFGSYGPNLHHVTLHHRQQYRTINQGRGIIHIGYSKIIWRMCANSTCDTVQSVRLHNNQKWHFKENRYSTFGQRGPSSPNFFINTDIENDPAHPVIPYYMQLLTEIRNFLLHRVNINTDPLYQNTDINLRNRLKDILENVCSDINDDRTTSRANYVRSPIMANLVGLNYNDRPAETKIFDYPRENHTNYNNEINRNNFSILDINNRPINHPVNGSSIAPWPAGVASGPVSSTNI